MARIYRTTDRITLKVDDLEIKVSPLSYHQKSDVQRLLSEGLKKNDEIKMNEGLILAIRHSLKSIKGLEDVDGNEYKLESEDGMLTEACVADLLNIEASPKLITICSQILNGIPKDFNIEGVSFTEGKK